MRLGRAAVYAIFAAVHIAENSRAWPIQGKDIATSCGMPPGRLLKILQQLVRSRILASERGPAGGFRLRKPARDISILEIIEAIEGPIDGDLFVGDGVATTERTRVAVQRACRDVADFARTRLQDLSVHDLAR